MPPAALRRLLALAAPAALGAALALLLAARGAPAAPAPPAAATAAATEGDWFESDWGQLVFFAVLEGLYADGVQPEVVSAVLKGPPGSELAPPAPGAPPDPEAWWRHELQTTLFVPACPLCTPALVAFETYAARGPLHVKAWDANGRPLDTFGPGLPDDVVARLQSPERAERLAALQALVSRWIARRLDFARATDAEREELHRWMEDGRKRGMDQLGALRRSLDAAAAASWPRCATCDGSVEGCAR
jgi:hypothetical protein